MVFRHMWRSIIGKAGQGGRVACARRRGARLLLEALEDRLVPTNYFVSTLGQDAAGAGAQANPFRSIQFAVDVAQSGDRIHVAQGTYGYNPAADQLSAPLRINPAVVMVYDKSLTIRGGFNNSFTALDPAANHTILDGGAALRGVYVLANQVDVSFDMEGFTIQACAAKAERNLDINAGNDRIFAFGGAMWLNDSARANSATPGTFTLRNMNFFSNRADGFDTTTLPAAEPGQTPGVGGAGAGAALALRFVPSLVMDQVSFNNNEAAGGKGAIRGGDAVGGAIHSDHSNITGTNLVFVNDRSIAGSSPGAGMTMDPGGISGGLQRRTADGLAGAAAIQINSTATFQHVAAYNNGAVGGDAAGQAGSGEAGAFLIEDSNVTMTDVDIRNNLARGGNGQDGGLSGGGAIATDGDDLTLNRVQIVNNVSQSGNGTRLAGSPGGGGLYLVAIKPGDRNTVLITNSLIADNQVRFGGQGDFSIGGGGGGVWEQGVNVTFTHVTFSGNVIGPNLAFGQALLLINDGLNNGFAPTPTTAVVNDSIFANHFNSNIPNVSTVHVRKQNGRNAITFNHALFANNTKDDNTDGNPGPGDFGIYIGLGTVIRAADAGFVSPGAPNYDYDLLPSSPAVDAGVGSTTATDIEGQPRTGTPDLGAFEAPRAPRAVSTVASFDPGTGLWQIRDSNTGGFANVTAFTYGLGGGYSTPVAGDWDGNGTTTVGVVTVVADPNNPNGPNVLQWNLRNENSPGAPDAGQFVYGQQGDIPVVGDWDGNGTTTIGIYSPGTGTWKLRNSNGPGGPDIAAFAFGGVAGTIPVTGDWDGNGTTTVGVVENTGGVLTWKLRNGNTSGGADAGVLAYGSAGYRPVTGDWNSDRQTTVGVFDPVRALWLLRNSNTPGGPDAGVFTFSEGNGIPLSGNWDGAAPLRAADSEQAGATASPPLTDEQLRAFAAAALGTTTLPRLEVAPLAGGLLGLAYPAEDTIAIDPTAAGYGWFVDPTPQANEEFDASLHALAGGPADGRMDLRTVLLHELGHLQGLPDADGSGGIMDGTLPAGVRRE